MAIGAPSHTHGLSFTRKPQPMNSPRTFLTEAVVAASGPGEGGQGAEGGGGREAARCSCAEDLDDGRGRPCALQRQVPAVLRVRSRRPSLSFRGWDFPVVTQRQVSTAHTPRSGAALGAVAMLVVVWRWTGGRGGGAAGGLVCF